MNIESEQELFSVLLGVADAVIEDVIKKLHEELLKNIRDIVYDPYDDKRIMYAYGEGKPTYQFLKSWSKTDPQIKGSEVQATIFNDPLSMTFDPDYYIHGSYDSDMREALAEILNKGTSKSIFGNGWWTKPRPFWDTTLELIQNGTVDKWIKEEFQKWGLNLQ
jgi:hypothetical protein